MIVNEERTLFVFDRTDQGILPLNPSILVIVFQQRLVHDELKFCHLIFISHFPSAYSFFFQLIQELSDLRFVRDPEEVVESHHLLVLPVCK